MNWEIPRISGQASYSEHPCLYSGYGNPFCEVAALGVVEAAEAMMKAAAVVVVVAVVEAPAAPSPGGIAFLNRQTLDFHRKSGVLPVNPEAYPKI